MDILYRTSTPAYKGCASPPEKRTGLLSEFWCYIFGGGSAPSYRTLNGRSGSAAARPKRCWWQAFPPTPHYKAAPALDIDVSASQPADPAGEPGAACDCPDGGDEIPEDDLPTGVYVWEE